MPRALGEVDAVVGGGDADLGCGARVHPARIGRAVGQLSALASDGLLHRFDQLFEIGVAARDDDAAYRLDPREVCHARRHVLGEADARDVADPRGALSRDPDRCRFEIGQRHFRGRIVAPLGDGPQRGYHIGEGEGTLAQLARFHLDADLPDVAADRGDLGDAGDRRERRAKHLVLEAAQVELRRHELRIAQGVFEHPTGAGSGRADLEPHVRGQPGAQFVDPIDDAEAARAKYRAHSKWSGEAVTFDGRLFGFCGAEMAKLFCFHPGTGQVSNLGVAVSVLERRRYGYVFGDAVTGRDGQIIFGEDDDLGHLWLYFPRIQG